MSKQIIFSEKAQKALQRGLDAVANAVKITLGPRGRNVALDKGFGAPTITNDGVTIAKEIDLKDNFENMGAEIVKEVADRTNEIAGDGTTTAVVLTQAMVKEGMRRIGMGANGIMVRHGIEAASKDVVKALHEMAKPIKNKAEIQQVATIAAESEEFGKIIAETIDKVGKDGVVTVEESQAFGVESEVVEGIEFDQGYISPYMVTNPERMEAEYRDPLILVTDQKISGIKEILPLLEQITTQGKKDLIIIADDVEGEALATFVVNKLRGTFNVLAVKAPGFGDSKKDALADIATVVGAQVITEDLGKKLESAKLSELGSASKVISTKDTTIIIGGKGDPGDIKARVSQLKKLKEQTQSKFDIEKIEDRIAKLAGGVAVIRVGAANETDMKYKKLKIEDAVAATKAAIEEGIVPGGGVALVRVAYKILDELHSSTLYKESHKSKKDSEYVVGYLTVLNALAEPMKQIAENAGYDGAVVIEKVRHAKGDAMGVDASGEGEGDPVVVDMMQKGIVDPMKVTRTALENAASAAAIWLTTEVAIAEEPKEEKEGPGGPGMGGMPGMM